MGAVLNEVEEIYLVKIATVGDRLHPHAEGFRLRMARLMFSIGSTTVI
jgi:hypothetical protein